jgi:hypothetical protein
MKIVISVRIAAQCEVNVVTVLLLVYGLQHSVN